MEKVYFRDNPKMSMMDTIFVMKNFLENSEGMNLSQENLDMMRKKFVECYCTLEDITEPKLTIELGRIYRENGVEFDEQSLKMSCLRNGIFLQQVHKSLPQEHMNLYKKSKVYFSNSYVYDFIYEYLEGNLIKTIISEIFKKFFELRRKFSVNIKISSERIEKLFENESISNKESFFLQQLNTWASYYDLIAFMECKIVEREEDETKKDILININLLKTIPKSF